MATRSSILAWRIPWTEEPGGLQSRGRKESDMTEHTHSYMRHLYIRHHSQCFMSINLLLTTILYGRVPFLHMFFRWGNRGTAWVETWAQLYK